MESFFLGNLSPQWSLKFINFFLRNQMNKKSGSTVARTFKKLKKVFRFLAIQSTRLDFEIRPGKLFPYQFSMPNFPFSSLFIINKVVEFICSASD